MSGNPLDAVSNTLPQLNCGFSIFLGDVRGFLLEPAAAILTRTAAPPFHGRLDFLFAGEIAGVSFPDCRIDFRDLPLVQIDLRPYGLGRDIRIGAFHEFGQLLKAAFGLAVDPNRRHFRHARIFLEATKPTSEPGHSGPV